MVVCGGRRPENEVEAGCRIVVEPGQRRIKRKKIGRVGLFLGFLAKLNVFADFFSFFPFSFPRFSLFILLVCLF